MMGARTAVIRTPDQRLRVFVSSTIQELARERAAAVEAIRSLKLTPVLFELGARPYPPRQLYRAYLEQSQVFVGVYGEQYGWTAPGMEISGLEDEYQLAGDRPKLIYVKAPAPNREDRLKGLLQHIEEHSRACYKTFTSPEELGVMLANDLAVLLSERFETTGVAPTTPLARGHEAPAGSPAGRWRLGVGVALVAVAVTVSLGLWLTHRVEQRKGAVEARSPAVAAPAVESTSIAVLPFVNMSPDPNQEYFSDGLSEELLNVLSKIPQLRVISRTSSFQFKGKSEDIRTIAQKLAVAHVLEGSVRKSGKRIRITAQLVDAATGSHLWSETYDRDLGDIFAIQDDIAGSVAHASKVTLLGTDSRPSTSGDGHAEAYTLYLQGNYFSRLATADNLEKAVGYYEQALKLDSGLAAAWVGLARAHNRQATQGFVPLEEGFKQSLQEVARALDLDPKMAVAYETLGFIRLTHDWDWTGADAAYQTALRLWPGNAAALGGAATLATALGRFDEAIELSRRAIELDPLNVVYRFNLGVQASSVGRWDEAEAALRKVLELNPEQPGGHATLGRIYLLGSKPDAALAEMQLEKHPSWQRYGLALAYQALGRKNEADSALRELIDKDGREAALQVAEVYAYRSDPDEAMQWLGRAYSQRDPGLAFLEGDPLFRSLEGDPRYRAFLRKMHLPQ